MSRGVMHDYFGGCTDPAHRFTRSAQTVAPTEGDMYQECPTCGERVDPTEEWAGNGYRDYPGIPNVPLHPVPQYASAETAAEWDRMRQVMKEAVRGFAEKQGIDTDDPTVWHPSNADNQPSPFYVPRSGQ